MLYESILLKTQRTQDTIILYDTQETKSVKLTCTGVYDSRNYGGRHKIYSINIDPQSKHADHALETLIVSTKLQTRS